MLQNIFVFRLQHFIYFIGNEYKIHFIRFWLDIFPFILYIIISKGILRIYSTIKFGKNISQWIKCWRSGLFSLLCSRLKILVFFYFFFTLPHTTELLSNLQFKDFEEKKVCDNWKYSFLKSKQSDAKGDLL